MFDRLMRDRSAFASTETALILGIVAISLVLGLSVLVGSYDVTDPDNQHVFGLVGVFGTIASKL